MAERPFDTKSITVGDGGGRRLHARIACSHQGCRRDEWRVVDTQDPTIIAAFWRGKGWAVGRTRRKDLCPDHAKPQRKPPAPKTAPPPASRPATPPPAPSPAAAPAPQPETPPMNAARQPTREDNRRILDALDTVYDVDHQRYKGQESDDTVAGKLDVPRAWVATIRDQSFGPDVNEAQTLLPTQLEAAIKELEAIRDRSFALYNDADAKLAEFRQLKTRADASLRGKV